MSTPNQGHEGGSQPMMSLQGGTGPVFTQAPMESENQMNARPQSDDMPAQMWDATVIAGGNKGGDTPNRDTSSNGMRPEPNPA
jgi:hypothetical protein